MKKLRILYLCGTIALIISTIVAFNLINGFENENRTRPVISNHNSMIDPSRVKISKDIVQEQEEETRSSSIFTLDMHVDAPYAGIYNSDGYEIFGKNSDDKVPMASTTKILTAATALEYLPKNIIMTVGYELDLVKPGSSLCYLAKGQQLSLYDALIGLLLPSGNDAAYVIASNTTDYILKNNNLNSAKKVEFFCVMMNKQAEMYGVENSNFVNPEGWDDPNHYTTVQDLAIITANAMKIPTIREIVAMPKARTLIYSGETLSVKNTNPLIQVGGPYYRENAIGVKTGSTSEAGKCLVGMISDNGLEYIVIALGCDGYKSRNQSIVDMIDTITIG